MAGAGRYAELSAAVRSFKAELLNRSQIERLLEAGSLSEAVSALSDGRVTPADSADLRSVETFLVERVIGVAERLAAYAPTDSRPLLRLLAAKYELDCVKQILKAFAEQIEPDETLENVIPAGRFTPERCKELVETRNPSRVIDMVEDEALARFLAPTLASDKGGLETSAAIDQYYYGRIWASSNLADPLDAQAARSLIGEAIDHVNILLALRSRLLGLDARTSAELLIHVNYRLGRAIDDLLEAANLSDAVRILDRTPYSKALEGTEAISGEDRIGKVEVRLNRAHASTCVNAFAGSPFNIGLALAFLFLKNYELYDLFTIVNAKANKVSSERIADSLILSSF